MYRKCNRGRFSLRFTTPTVLEEREIDEAAHRLITAVFGWVVEQLNPSQSDSDNPGVGADDDGALQQRTPFESSRRRLAWVCIQWLPPALRPPWTPSSGQGPGLPRGTTVAPYDLNALACHAVR